jgi:hypothetical protein
VDSFAQKGPGNFARGWKYSLYTAVTMMYATKTEALSAKTLGYGRLPVTSVEGMFAIRFTKASRGVFEEMSSVLEVSVYPSILATDTQNKARSGSCSTNRQTVAVKTSRDIANWVF